jgi:hypothetical protein
MACMNLLSEQDRWETTPSDFLFWGTPLKNFPRVTCAILAPNSGTESEILSRRTYQFAGIWQFYKYGWLMRISEIFLLENLSINVPYHGDLETFVTGVL